MNAALGRYLSIDYGVRWERQNGLDRPSTRGRQRGSAVPLSGELDVADCGRRRAGPDSSIRATPLILRSTIFLPHARRGYQRKREKE